MSKEEGNDVFVVSSDNESQTIIKKKKIGWIAGVFFYSSNVESLILIWFLFVSGQFFYDFLCLGYQILKGLLTRNQYGYYNTFLSIDIN